MNPNSHKQNQSKKFIKTTSNAKVKKLISNRGFKKYPTLLKKFSPCKQKLVNGYFCRCYNVKEFIVHGGNTVEGLSIAQILGHRLMIVIVSLVMKLRRTRLASRSHGGWHTDRLIGAWRSFLFASRNAEYTAMLIRPFCKCELPMANADGILIAKILSDQLVRHR